MSENGESDGIGNGAGEVENGKKSLPERNERGQFKIGNSGGPGRGKRKPFKKLGQDEFEGVIAEGLRSKDGKERAVWARVMIAYEKQNKPDDSDRPEVDPVVYDMLLGGVFAIGMDYELKTGPASNREIAYAIREHLLSCPGSPVRPIPVEGGDGDNG